MRFLPMETLMRSQFDSTVHERAVPSPPHFPTEAELWALEQGAPQAQHRAWSALRARFAAFLLDQADPAESDPPSLEGRGPPLAAPAA
ncbi:MAG: hypothetical protein CL878_07555 [Dehalococcoidia bacterium]|nr:hypothetical protein [Dehalococcoidia bacterium]